MIQSTASIGSLQVSDKESSDMGAMPDDEIDALFALLGNQHVAVRGGLPERDTLPAGELRFIVEFPDSAVFEQGARTLTRLFVPNSPVLERLFQSDAMDCETFYVLRFYHSPKMLSRGQIFDIAYALKQSLGLASCEPDQTLFSGHVAKNTKAAIQGFGAPPASAPEDRLWAIKNIRANKAWKIAAKKGMDVSIALPDTGVLSHPKLEGDSVDLSLTRDVLTGLDYLPEMKGEENLGSFHATAMASVAVSRQTGGITGPAPAARIVAIRSATSSTEYNSAATARAIEYAVGAGCRVISIAIPGAYCRAVEEAIEYAISNGVIVLASAGDTADSVSYPARYTDVVAVGGATVNDLPWNSSGCGKSISFLAPAEHVWSADISSESGAVSPQGGTALAVALAAGAAALWLSHHGVEELDAIAADRSLSVQQLFLTAVRYTARRPNNWDDTRFGAGIIDCEALVKLEPQNIPTVNTPQTIFGPQIGTVVALVQEQTKQVPDASRFDLATFSTEICALAYDRSSGESIQKGGRIADWQRPSKHLQLAIERSGDRALKKLLE